MLRPGGWIAVLTCAPGSMMGELTAALSHTYPAFASEVAPPEWFDPDFPPRDTSLGRAVWGGVPVRRVLIRDFTSVTDYGDPDEAAAVLSRIYGPAADRYVRNQDRSTLAWRLRISLGQVVG